ncbi:hypothetical protein [Vibrio gazogenes]|uniref:Uncharacterized protein n=1 Tax=Vibrio gazogenes TaxID=687 RepID=A0A1Z2SGU2_VIBGA|nr:hypothetical protein [Vibrio gazogenes]ASA56404.1 hypothetical protein BSQ33_12345 [Vibrio gazogenes]
MNITNPVFNQPQNGIDDITGLSEKLTALSNKDAQFIKDILSLNQSSQRLTQTSQTLADRDSELEKKIDAIIHQTPVRPTSARNLLINPDFQENQRNFKGDWSALKTGQYGFDCWCKTASGIAQMVEDGDYQPQTVYTLSGENMTTRQLTSPSSGHWRIDVPAGARKIVLSEGNTATPYQAPDRTLNRLMCWARYYDVGSKVTATLTEVGGMRWAYIEITLPVQMRTKPTAGYNSYKDFNPAPTIGTWSSGKRVYVTGRATLRGADPSVTGLRFDAEIPLA